MRNIIRALAPKLFLAYFRKYKKNVRTNALKKQERRGEVITQQGLSDALRKIGIQTGDVLLVHASLSKVGFVQGGAETVVNTMLECVGPNGHLLMPTSPNDSFQLDYIRNIDVFDLANTPSKLGAISECFRKHPLSVRSAHPTEPVSCIGPSAREFVDTHFGCQTPYTSNSPFYKVVENKGKILYLGVTLANAGTNLHLLEDAIEQFKFPVYHPELFNVKIRFEDGELKTMKTLVHNPQQSKKRRCDELIPLFESKGVLKKVMIGQAESLLVDAKGMFDVMVTEYKERGVTMYTPFGS